LQGIKKMNKAIKILKDYVNKDINLDQIEILLHLADNEPKPVAYSTLSKLMDGPMLSISLNIDILKKYYIKDSIDKELVDSDFCLVKTSPSKFDSREQVAFLTDKGTKVVWMLNELIR
jgi:DNA-binding MarR family transcriptional regulator